MLLKCVEIEEKRQVIENLEDVFFPSFIASKQGN
jgi:hypothetical protein